MRRKGSKEDTRMERGLTQEEVDDLRRKFAVRMRNLIGVGQDPKVSALEEFSRATGISMRQLSQWANERHLSWPSVKNLIQISEAAGVSLDWLLKGDKPPKKAVDGKR